jgi:hypothetical protein
MLLMPVRLAQITPGNPPNSAGQIREGDFPQTPLHQVLVDEIEWLANGGLVTHQLPLL